MKNMNALKFALIRVHYTRIISKIVVYAACFASHCKLKFTFRDFSSQIKIEKNIFFRFFADIYFLFKYIINNSNRKSEIINNQKTQRKKKRV
jgi:hypothetical protein